MGPKGLSKAFLVVHICQSMTIEGAHGPYAMLGVKERYGPSFMVHLGTRMAEGMARFEVGCCSFGP